MNDILKEQNTNEKVKKYNNYQKALYGGRDAPAVVGSSSSAATNDYNAYLSARNSFMQAQNSGAGKQNTAVSMSAGTQRNQNTPQMAAAQQRVQQANQAVQQRMSQPKNTAQAAPQTAQQSQVSAQAAPQAAQQSQPSVQTAQQSQPSVQSAATYDPSLYESLSSYDKGLPQESLDQVLGGKSTWQEGNAVGDTAKMREGRIQAQFARALGGGYIDDIGDGTGRREFGLHTLSAADRSMSLEDQKKVLEYAIRYMMSDNPVDQKYYHDAANNVRRPYGFTSTDGSDYVPNDPTSDVYGGYRDFENPYTDQINQLVNYISNREYDPESDPAYQAYKAQYERNASAAANSAMAQAAGNTGGIANSYAMALSNAAQQAYMKQLSDVIPTLQQQDYADRMSLLQNLNNLQSSAYDRYANGRDFDYNAWMQAWQNVFDKNQADRDYNETIASREWQTSENQKDRDYDWKKYTFGY